jgi:hypothetical protein
MEKRDREWALLAKAVLERISFVVSTYADKFNVLMQPTAEQIGAACGCDEWTIKLFSEEVVRGGPGFALSMLMQKIDPVIRDMADMGKWQVRTRVPNPMRQALRTVRSAARHGSHGFPIRTWRSSRGPITPLQLLGLAICRYHRSIRLAQGSILALTDLSLTSNAVRNHFSQPCFCCKQWVRTRWRSLIASWGVSLNLAKLALPLPLALDLKVLSSRPSQIISPTAASGYVYVVDDLSTIQHRVFERPTVVIAKHVSGAEEIPMGATAVLSGSSVDVLSHSAVRARNSKVFFATCYDAEVTQSLVALEGQVRI